ncbi:MAG TPA: glycosyltransferase [Candidatus Limnocylindrales bacterium]|nr:glycosyltransferase [Candidatus Limnocylindrales bacterium]
MRIALVSIDTRGGIQPYLALARGLDEAGHDARLVAPENYAADAARHGVRFAPIRGDVEEAVRMAGAPADGGSLAAQRVAARETMARIGGWVEDTLAALDGCDMAAGGVGGQLLGEAAAEKLGIPFVEAHLQPVGAPTGRYQGPLFGSTPRILGAPGRYLSHRISEIAFWLPFRDGRREARARLGLPPKAPRARRPTPVLYGFSRHVVPVPTGDGRRPRHVTGYWFLPPDPAWHPDPALEAFLERDGAPVVCVGFGSMATRDPEGMARLVTGAVRDAGLRAVLLSGWGGLASATGDGDDIHVAREVPHEWLLPRMAAVVHHGGAGTTGAGLRAGIPSVVVPFGVDQPFWASRVVAVGAGPAPIARSALTRDRLAGALTEAVRNPRIADGARRIGERIRAEDGVAAAVTVLGGGTRP